MRRDVNYSEDAVQSAAGDDAWTPPARSIAVGQLGLIWHNRTATC